MPWRLRVFSSRCSRRVEKGEEPLDLFCVGPAPVLRDFERLGRLHGIATLRTIELAQFRAILRCRPDESAFETLAHLRLPPRLASCVSRHQLRPAVRPTFV